MTAGTVGTVVIGGGAAGIAAARRLHDAGHDVLLIEARDRLGGRALSFVHHGQALDLGCGWLHSAGRNPWTEIARKAGFDIRTDTANWGTQWRDLGYPREEQAAFAKAWEDWERAAHAALPGPDRPLSDFVAPDDRWRPLLDAISGFANGAPLSRVALHDWAAHEDASYDDNWAVSEGYGTLIAGHAGGLPARLSTVVRRIDHHGRTLKIDTSAGTITAERAVVAVPTSVLARGAIVFDPPLPDKQAAAADLPLGLADKVFLSVADTVEWPDNAHLIGNPRCACTASYRLSPFGWPVIEGFFGGDCAEALDDADASAFAIDELVALLGGSWRARLSPIVTTRWRHEPFIHGSYSHARIGRAPQRAALAAPVDQRLFFAGEACSTHDFSTAHGAYATGRAQADSILAPSA
jgi:monoamine oxidase